MPINMRTSSLGENMFWEEKKKKKPTWFFAKKLNKQERKGE